MTKHGSLITFSLVAVAACGQAYAQAPAGTESLWNCKDKDGRTMLTNKHAETIGKDCSVVQQQRITVVPSTGPSNKSSPATRYAKDSAYRTQVDSFRASLKPGDKTDQGLVIEVKAPIVRVQKPQGDHWVRIEELFPQ